MFRDPYYSNLFSWLPDLLLGIIVLIVGFIFAKVAENLVVKAMKKGRVNERLNLQYQKWSADRIAGKIVFFGILLLTILIFFNMMNLNTISSPFLGVFAGLSGAVIGILKAGLILLLAWVLATVVRKLILSAGHKVNVHKYVSRVGGAAESVDKVQYVSTAANVAFYLILLLFIPAVLDALGLNGVSGPFENLLTGFVAFVPKLVGAALIFAVGIIIAKIVRMIVTKLLESIGTDKIADKLNVSSAMKGTSISKVIGTIVFVLILIPVTISALEVLDLDGISQPAIVMLNDIMVMLPKIVVAIALILVGVYVAKWVKGVVETLLANLGVDSLSNKMGVKSTNRSGSLTVSSVIGTVVQIVIILLFVVEALQIVQLAFMVTLATAIFAYLPMVLAAVLILAVGFWLANLAEKFIGSVMQTKQGTPHILRYVAKYAILAFAFFMALSQLGIAPAIINAAFILILGGVALAFGLAFGLGGRDHASRYLSKMESSLQDADVSKEKWEEQKEEMKLDVNQIKREAREGMNETKTDMQREKEQMKRAADQAQASPVNPSDEVPGNPEESLKGPAHSDVNDAPLTENFGGNEPASFTEEGTDPGYNEVEPGEEYPFGEHDRRSRFNKEAHDQWNNQKPNNDSPL